MSVRNYCSPLVDINRPNPPTRSVRLVQLEGRPL